MLRSDSFLGLCLKASEKALKTSRDLELFILERDISEDFKKKLIEMEKEYRKKVKKDIRKFKNKLKEQK